MNKFEQKTHELCDGKPVVDGKIINYKHSFMKIKSLSHYKNDKKSLYNNGLQK